MKYRPILTKRGYIGHYRIKDSNLHKNYEYNKHIKAWIRKQKEGGITRISLVKMYYSNKRSKHTPDPIAEFRAYVCTENPQEWNEQNFLKNIEMMELSTSIIYGIDKGKITMDVKGLEVERIDNDEFANTSARSGVSLSIDEIGRYAAFYSKDGSIKCEMNEADWRKAYGWRTKR